MTEDLSKRRCEPCKLGSALVRGDEASQLLLSIPAWKHEWHEGVEKLIRTFHFVEFNDAFEFTRKIVAMSNREDHHPAIMTEWGKVTVYWWSHKVNGLHINDFIMAAKTDVIARLSAPA